MSSLYQLDKFSQKDLDKFSAVQKLSYECVESVGKQLTEGMTEKEAVRLMTDWMSAKGVTTFFHKPFAWFGDRTRFKYFIIPIQFFPTKRKLSKGMPVILDIAPIVDGYAADIGYSIMFGEEDDTIHAKMRKDLIKYRKFIHEQVNLKSNFSLIYKKLNKLFHEDGYVNIHKKYPRRVLAHRVMKVRDPEQVSKRHLLRFGLDQFKWLVPHSLLSALLPHVVKSHLWNDWYESDHVPYEGLWAVEPHIGYKGYGVKWEELLVIDDSGAYWLDDNLPHMREAKRKKW